jgi:serine acetyltransferase
MFDLTFLGTSASVPSADRNHPSLLVEAGGQACAATFSGVTIADDAVIGAGAVVTRDIAKGKTLVDNPAR